MENQQLLHIIVTGEDGKGRSLTIRKKTIRNFILCGVIGSVVFLASCATIYTMFAKGVTLQKKMAELQEPLSNFSTQRLSLLEKLKQKDAQLSAYKHQIDELKTEHNEQKALSISRLEERTQMIDSIMKHIGVKVKVEEDPEHSGGPYVATAKKKPGKALLESTDHYLKLLEMIPLGRPVPGSVSSKFGWRKDPFNHKKAFHEGLDFRGRIGENVISTANGVVRTLNCGRGYGKCLIIKHGKDYQTVYAHLKKRKVKVGQKVTRGQVIGLLGNSGRSTGPHLHYEVRFHGKPINPMNFVQVGSLNLTAKH